MAVLTDVMLSIDRSSYPDGSICSIHYSYTLVCDPQEVQSEIGFSVWCQLWGQDVLLDQMLGELMYDTHTLSARNRQKNSRTFVVPCKILNEDIGRDEIYCKVCARSSLGVDAEAISPVVKDNF
ncbi:MAG: hypothetical protein OEZ58_12270 [Gammaproteobacteria bacterium]|nr:hypothetical protein [Gammaproteobacteria bacterium]MDH5729760.1 hypothetical protein [Gammaproteobacteria bacterium]